MGQRSSNGQCCFVFSKLHFLLFSLLFAAYLIWFLFTFSMSVCLYDVLTSLFISVFMMFLQPVVLVFYHVILFISPSGFDALGDLLKPTVPAHTAPPPHPQMAIHPGGKLLANDLDSSLANLVGSECLDTCARIADHVSKGKRIT